MKKITTLILIFILISVGVYFREDIKSYMRNDIDVTNIDTNVLIKVYLDDMILNQYNNMEYAVDIQKSGITSPETLKFAAALQDEASFLSNQLISAYFTALNISYGQKIIAEDPMAKKAVDLDSFKELYTKNAKQSIKVSERFLRAINKIETNSGITDGTLTITNSHPGIDASKEMAKSIIEKSTKNIEFVSNL